MKDFTNYNGNKGIEVKLDRLGTKRWSEATNKFTNRRLHFVLDNQIFSSAIINSQITGGVLTFWVDGFSNSQIKRIKALIED